MLSSIFCSIGTDQLHMSATQVSVVTNTNVANGSKTTGTFGSSSNGQLMEQELSRHRKHTSKQSQNSPQCNRSLKQDLSPHEGREEDRSVDKELIVICVDVECFQVRHECWDHRRRVESLKIHYCSRDMVSKFGLNFIGRRRKGHQENSIACEAQIEEVGTYGT